MFYVYEFIDPRDQQTFYVGKGTGGRINARRYKKQNIHLYRKINSIRKSGFEEIRKKIKEFGDEIDALKYEKTLIGKYGLANLCNQVLADVRLLSGRNHPRFNDIQGQRFSRLEAIEHIRQNQFGQSIWRCRCRCGTVKDVAAYRILSGELKSCGCLRDEQKKEKHPSFKNLVGKKYGKLTVTEYTKVYKNNQSLWRCRCDCGINKIISGSKLRSGHTKSCGCSRRGKNNSNFKDLTDKYFGVLAVEKYMGSNHHQKSVWRCRCECNEIVNITGSELLRGAAPTQRCKHHNE